LIGIYILSCFILILFVLLQPGKSDASAIFGGGGASSTAFGPRGTQSVLARVTVGAAVVFFLVAFLFSIPGLFEKKSLGQGITNSGPTQQAPVTPAPGAVPQATIEPLAVPGASVSPTDVPAAKPGASKAAGKGAAGNGGATTGNATAPVGGNGPAPAASPKQN